MTDVLEIENLHKSFRLGSQVIRALNGVSLSVAQGTLAAIMGASGSGKSTLLHMAGGLDLPDSGTVRIESKDLTRMSDRQRTLFRRKRIGIIFQAYNLLPTLTAEENVAVPLLIDGLNSSQIRSRVAEMIRLVHLEHRAGHRPQAMSGGEQQRVAIARALLNDPALILADEPTGNIDSISAVEVWELLRRLAHEMGKTVLMVTHEAAAASYADRIYVLKDGQIIGRIEGIKPSDAALVASRYTELAR
ncbi:MAG TPA: ABC transporter ATP-binding protein [Phycisphaerae bacterium]|nr:ABC transporter ATP-binding protein [Phycisphaerae bacterium]HRR83535.1 ABC transporter ATP-binding protein [Phycisphaerae bacterium]